MTQLSTREQLTQKLTTIGDLMAFNNEQNSYLIVSYKRPWNDKCKTIQTRKLMARIMFKIMNEKHKIENRNEECVKETTGPKSRQQKKATNGSSM